MIVTKVEEWKSKKYRIYIDDEFTFTLYSKELHQFHIRKGVVISQDIVFHILDTVIYKRAKERALFLLERKPLSINMMRMKLQENGYSPYIIDRVISFLEIYHYLDDEEYTRMYIHTYSCKKSKKQLKKDLLYKGISRDVIDTYFENNIYSEQDCFEKQFQKYIKGKNLENYSDRQKIFRYIYSKGFSVSLIEKYMKTLQE